MAALVIDSNSIINDTYTYTLDFNTISNPNGTTKGVMENDVFLLENMRYGLNTNGSGQHRTYFQMISVGTGSSFASLTYKFDFSNLGYAVTSMTINDFLYLAAPGSASGKTYSATTYYSFTGDNGDWTEIRSISTNTGVGFTGGTDGATKSTTIDFSTLNLSELPSTVYYKVDYKSVGGTFVNTNDVRWSPSQSEIADTDTFSASFKLTQIPEASTLAWTFVLSGIGAVTVLRRRACR